MQHAIDVKKNYVFRKKKKLTTFNICKVSWVVFSRGDFRGLFLCRMQLARLQEHAGCIIFTDLLVGEGPNWNLLLKKQGFLACDVLQFSLCIRAV
jgi:hypothetical protein